MCKPVQVSKPHPSAGHIVGSQSELWPDAYTGVPSELHLAQIPASSPAVEHLPHVPLVQVDIPAQTPVPQAMLAMFSSACPLQLLSFPSQSSSAPGNIEGLLSLQSPHFAEKLSPSASAWQVAFPSQLFWVHVYIAEHWLDTLKG